MAWSPRVSRFLEKMSEESPRHAGPARFRHDTHAGDTRNISRTVDVGEAGQAFRCSRKAAVGKVRPLVENETGESGRIHVERASDVTGEGPGEYFRLLCQRHIVCRDHFKGHF